MHGEEEEYKGITGIKVNQKRGKMDLTISILDLKNEGFIKNIYNLEEAGIKSFHIDVMDYIYDVQR